jgi:hypothetical protein
MSEQLNTWDESPLHETCPWPGYEAYKSANVLYQLDSEVNIKDHSTGQPQEFDKRKEKGDSFTKKEFSAYGG